MRHREPSTAVVLAIGAAASVSAAWVFAAIRAATPSHTPDVGGLLDDPGVYLRAELPYVAAWICLTYGIAIAVAALMGYFATAECFREKVDRDVSVWWRVFREGVDESRASWTRRLVARGKATDPNALPPTVRIELLGGGCVEGELVFHNSSHEDHQNRDLALTSPRYIVPPPNCEPLDEPGYIVVSASQIKLMTVTHRTVIKSARDAEEPAT